LEDANSASGLVQAQFVRNATSTALTRFVDFKPTHCLPVTAQGYSKARKTFWPETTRFLGTNVIKALYSNGLKLGMGIVP
jgi:hypothetical protein